MRNDIPPEFTGRFSIKAKKSSPQSSNKTSTSGSQEPKPEPVPMPAPTPLPESLRDEPVPFHERKRKLAKDHGDESSRRTKNDDDELNIYSQHLVVHPSPDHYKYRLTGQSELQEQHRGIFDKRLPTENERDKLHRQSNVPDSEEPHEYQEEAFNLFRFAWSNAGRREPDVAETARQLAYRAGTVKDANTLLYVRCILRAMHQYASEQPQALDFMLLTYVDTMQRLPASFLDKHGNGPEAAITQLKWMLIEEVNGFDGILLPKSTATIDVADPSNLNFQSAQVSANLEGVLAQVYDWKHQRKMWFIGAATQSRCFALDILRKRTGQDIEALIDAGLDRRQSQRSKVSMLGACIMLRGCAKTLGTEVPTSGIKMSAWKASLEKFLLQDEETRNNDFVIKLHAALALSNLIDGPYDETSEQLFAPGSWIS